jgi:hypothetical protein
MIDRPLAEASPLVMKLIGPYFKRKEELQRQTNENDAIIRAILTAHFPPFEGGDYLFSDGKFIYTGGEDVEESDEE